MSITVKIQDATTLNLETDSTSSVFILDLLTERITVRDLIRSRVYQDVKDYNTRQPEYFRGLVQPTEAEQSLNGYKLKKPRQLNWESQLAKAIAAFEGNSFLILVDDEQVTELDEDIVITPETTITFLKLVPLVGG
ncbi:MAG: hypothetical protein VKK07_02365 [Merismopediaceae bacterium]|nr:hypothetical protein [Merismopediaceae bacterium]